jgi:multidrug transporter EmrE-like cation transporter
MNLWMFVLLLSGVLLNASAQLLLKVASVAIRAQLDVGTFNLETLARVLWAALTNVYLIVGLACYVVSVALWVVVLGRVAVSVAYPMQAIGYVFAAVIAYVVFGERLSLVQMVGMGAIIGGVVLLNQS